MVLKRAWSGIARAGKRFYKQNPQLVGAVAGKAIRAGAKYGYKKGMKMYKDYKKSTKQRQLKGRDTFKDIQGHNDLRVMKVPVHMNPGKLGKTAGTFSYKVTKQKVVSGQVGRQVVTSMYPVAFRNHFNGSLSIGPQAYEFPDDPFLLNPYNVPVNNAVYVISPQPAIPIQSKIGLLSVRQEVTILNMETSPIDFEIIWYMAKRDANSTPDGQWSTGVTTEGEAQGVVINRTSFLDTVTPGREDYTSWGAKPYKDKVLNKHFKTVATCKFVLNGGDQKKLLLRFNYKKVIAREIFQLSPNGWMSGYTVQAMVIAKGGVVGIASNAETPSSEVSYASARFGYIQTDTYRFANLPGGFGQDRSRRVEGQLINPVGGLVERIIDDDDDAANVQSI